MPEYRWLGFSAPYGPNEINIIATLPVREQAFLHTLKAFMEGELSSALEPVPTSGAVGAEDSRSGETSNPLGIQGIKHRAPAGSLAPSDQHGYRVPRPGKSDGIASSIVYTDPEDIPFGAGVQTPRKRPTYALVWTWRQSRVFKTKRECIEKQRVWKKWYERQGWKVTSHATGYFARHPSGQSHSISLHEYDRETNERLR